MKMTNRIAHSLGMDAANCQMRDNGRTVWNEDDYDLAAHTLNTHFPLCAEVLGVEPQIYGCERCRQLG